MIKCRLVAYAIIINSSIANPMGR